MNILIRGKNIEVTDALRDYVEKRVSKLEKYLGQIRNAQVTLLVEKGDHKVEVTIPINGMVLRGEEISPDMYSSVDLVIDKLEKQVERYKAKLAKKLRVPAAKEGMGAQWEEESPLIARTKRFALKPMAVEEAVMQMNLIGHNFFVFANADTEEVNVVYRRKDGNYGLIEPEA